MSFRRYQIIIGGHSDNNDLVTKPPVFFFILQFSMRGNDNYKYKCRQLDYEVHTLNKYHTLNTISTALISSIILFFGSSNHIECSKNIVDKGKFGQ